MCCLILVDVMSGDKILKLSLSISKTFKLAKKLKKKWLDNKEPLSTLKKKIF